MKEKTLELQLSKTLRWGIVISSIFLVIGTIVLFVMHVNMTIAPPSIYQLISSIRLEGVLHGLITNPFFYLYAGILLLMITPIMRIIISVISFIAERDWRFAFVTLFVLGVVIFSVMYSIVK